MMKCGLLGRKLSHSYSPLIHSMLGDYSYTLFEKEPEEIEDFLKFGQWDGLNVTAPYKKAVIPFLDELTPIAGKLGAVNTIVRRNGRLIGHNTDYFGFQMLLDSLSLDVNGKKVLVLGSGGASNTAAAVLRDKGAEVVIVSRTGENNYSNYHSHRDTHLIVNTTPVGMYPDNGVTLLPELTERKIFPCLRGVLDVIYNPARTRLLLDAEKDGSVKSANGLLMLAAQAKEAAEWFTRRTVEDAVIEQIVDTLEARMHNVVLIGMPGCGKTTVGKALAERTGREFADSDDLIERLAGKTIPDIFADDGEEAFREWETKALSELGKQSGLIIATGGGCVTRNRNYDLLHQNGDIFWIRRQTDSLPTHGRPLSQRNDLQEMYRIREPLYEQWKDWSVDNSGTIGDAVRQFLNILEV